MPRKKKDIQEDKSTFVAYSGSAPAPIAAGQQNESYTSADGTKVYVQFLDSDSSGLYPSRNTFLTLRENIKSYYHDIVIII